MTTPSRPRSKRRKAKADLRDKQWYGEQKPQRLQGVVPEGHAPRFYWTEEWRRLRRVVLLRDQGVCQYCGDAAITADHIIARKLGGPDVEGNLVAVCDACNRTVGGQAFTTFEEKRDYVRRVRQLAEKPTLRARLHANRAKATNAM